MELKEALGALYQKAKEQHNIQQQPQLILRKDDKNAEELYTEVPGIRGAAIKGELQPWVMKEMMTIITKITPI